MRFIESILHCAWLIANTQCTTTRLPGNYFHLTLIINSCKSSIEQAPEFKHNPKYIAISLF